MNNKTKTVTMLGMATALYVVLAMIMKIPLLAGTHLQTDLGYIAFGASCFLFGWPAAIVGVLGCFIESLIFSGWVPIGWMVGQAVIGLMCGFAYKKIDNKIINILITVLAVFIGVAGIKTVIECGLYGIPFAVKFAKNFVAFIADAIPMVIGLFIGEKI